MVDSSTRKVRTKCGVMSDADGESNTLFQFGFCCLIFCSLLFSLLILCIVLFDLACFVLVSCMLVSLFS